MRRIIRWLTFLLPPGYLLVIAALSYLGVEYLAWQAAGNWQNLLRAANWAPVQEILKLRDAILIAASCFYGMWRVVAFHPFYRPAYAEWLKGTPWTRRHPLPAGPIRWAVQDLLVAGVLLAAMHSSNTPRQWIPVALLIGHSMTAGLALFWTGPRAIAYAIGFLMGLLVLVSREPYDALMVAVGISLVAHGGIWSSLAHFPWELPETMRRFLLSLIGRQAELPKQVLGYPYEGLSPLAAVPPLPLRDGIALSLLPAWLAFTLITVGGEQVLFGVAMFCTYLFPTLVIGRCVNYLATCRPPISLWGRIMTGRWIIPGFDRVIAAPLLAIIFGVGIPIAALRYKMPPVIFVPACIAAVLLTTLTMGPSLLVWRLTGVYRLVPTRDRKNLIEL